MMGFFRKKTERIDVKEVTDRLDRAGNSGSSRAFLVAMSIAIIIAIIGIVLRYYFM